MKNSKVLKVTFLAVASIELEDKMERLVEQWIAISQSTLPDIRMLSFVFYTTPDTDLSFLGGKITVFEFTIIPSNSFS